MVARDFGAWRWPIRRWSAAGHPTHGRPARTAVAGHPTAPWKLSSNCSPAPASPVRRPAHLPGAARLLSRPRPQRASRDRRTPRGNDELGE